MKNKGRYALIVLGYLAVLTALAYAVLAICVWVLGRAEQTQSEEMPVSAKPQITVQEGQVALGQDELDQMIADAREAAIQETMLGNEEAIEEASASARMEVLNGIKSQLEAGELTTVEVLRPFYPDDLVVVSGGAYHFVPIDRSLKQNFYAMENLNVLENGEIEYLENGEVISHKGIDVSKFQGKIDWKAVAADGVEFAFMRAGYRGYGKEGRLVEDATFDDNMAGALAAGIHPGVYFYTQAINEEEVLEEADFVLEKLAPYNVKCPVIFDVEKTSEKTGRMNQLSPEERTNLTLLFCQTIERAGYKPILYHNMEMAALMIDIATFEDYDKWFAYYNQDLYYPYAYKIWQYSDKGQVAGINGNVDLNISFTAFWEE